MLIYHKQLENKMYVYIHIPKNGGKFIRNQICSDENNTIVTSLWGIDEKQKIDYAHMPYMKHIQYFANTKCNNESCNFVKNTKKNWPFCCNACNQNGSHGPLCEKISNSNIDFANCIYYSFSRNPYDRIISAFFYKKIVNKQKASIEDFKNFCKTTLPKLVFDFSYDAKYIHYYPQYLFVCDENYNITKTQIEKLESTFKPTTYDVKKYLDNECISIINKIYENDFVLFNYDRMYSV